MLRRRAMRGQEPVRPTDTSSTRFLSCLYLSISPAPAWPAKAGHGEAFLFSAISALSAREPSLAPFSETHIHPDIHLPWILDAGGGPEES
jgi:hypothetical protein